MSVTPRPLADRFWPKVQKAGADECWLWTASVGSHGYGQLSMPGRGPEPAHRIAWTLTNGDIPPGMWVLHRCDIQRCCNPAHLFLGTDADNVADMHQKKRGRMPERQVGDRHPKTKLSDADVTRVRALRAQGESYAVLSKAFGVSISALSQIVNGRARTHVSGEADA